MVERRGMKYHLYPHPLLIPNFTNNKQRFFLALLYENMLADNIIKHSPPSPYLRKVQIATLVYACSFLLMY